MYNSDILYVLFILFFTKMKRKISVLILALLTLFPFALAQDSSVWDVVVQFCNSDEPTKNLSMVLEWGMEKEICMDFSNYSNNDVTINYGFVDGTIAIGDTPKKACKNEWEIAEFGQYVTQDNDTITILAWQTVRQKAKIKYPAGFSGMVNGCLTYSVAWNQPNMWDEDNMFTILVRRAKFIDVLVGGELKRDVQFSNNDAVSYYYDSKANQFVINISLTNAGNVDENVTVSGVVSNSFGYNKDISEEDIKVISDSKKDIQVVADEIPWYKLSYKADLTLIWAPEFAFDPATLPDSVKEPITIHLSLDMFQFPWIILVYVLWWIIFIILVCFLAKHLKFQK